MDIITNIKNSYLRAKERWHADARYLEEEERQKQVKLISRQFTVADQDGRLYILCNGYAIAVIDGNKTVNETLRYLEDARHTATAYAGI